MKTRYLWTLAVSVLLATTNSSAQDSENSNPYAIFGRTPYVAGAKDAGADGEKVFVIENFAEGSKVARIEHNPQTGIIKLFDEDGVFLAARKLLDNDRAWPTMDRKAEKYYAISPYAFCAGNPLRYVDPNGMEFTDAAWIWVNKLIEKINSMQEYNNNKIAGKQAQLAAGGLSEKQTNRLNRQIDRLNNANNGLETIRGEIGTLAASNQVYDVQTDNSLNTSDIMGGGFSFDFSSGNAKILMPSSGGMGLFAHELKHAYQFEIGQLSIGPRMSNDSNGYTNFAYDKHDEVAAYSRGAIFGQTAYGVNNLPAAYNNLPTGPIDVVTYPGLAAINALPAPQRPAVYQSIANSTRHAFRVGGQTYYRPR